jgi:TPR repeat protein
MQGLGPAPNLGTDLTKPCILGPGELCATLAELIAGCDAGDADDCLAVGQFLADAPPRPLIAHVFFTQACRIGDATGCERLDQLKPPSSVPCDQDPFACEWRGYRARDQSLLDQACSLGAADACVNMAELTKGDVARSRSYLEQACQLGNAMTCEELGHRLSPGCAPSADRTCYPPDPAEAAAALAIACTAGFETACK